jgi:hypothetical protein
MSAVATRFARHRTRPGGLAFSQPGINPRALEQIRFDPPAPGATPETPAVSGGGPAAADPGLRDALARSLADETPVTEPTPPPPAARDWSAYLNHPAALAAAALLAAGGTYLALSKLFPATRARKASGSKKASR